jgi:hypothetical protein
MGLSVFLGVAIEGSLTIRSMAQRARYEHGTEKQQILIAAGGQASGLLALIDENWTMGRRILKDAPEFNVIPTQRT